MMRKNINDYSLYVFDLDGTLYDQPKLRLIMAGRLIGYYICHPFSVKDLIIIMHFRRLKDSWEGNAREEDIIRKTADDLKVSFKRADGVVRKWIYDNPLSALAKTKDEKLIGWIRDLRKKGKKAVVLSDYPTADKLKALGVEFDGQYGPDDTRIDELKSSPKGLSVIMDDTHVMPSEILMIGDRPEKDGECAKAAGVDHLILDRNVKKRKINEEV